MRLSGRQVKKADRHAAPALLAGLWVVLSRSALLARTDLKMLADFSGPLTFPARGSVA